MILNIKKNYETARLPERNNPSDAGWDVFVHSMKIVGEKIGNLDIYSSISYIEYDTGLSICPNASFSIAGPFSTPENYFTYLAPRSSISKYNLLNCNGFGTIDRTYTGPLMLRMKYIFTPDDVVFLDPEKHPSFGIRINEKKIYQVGDKCGQLIVTNQPFVEIEEVHVLEETERGANGFGSSGI